MKRRWVFFTALGSFFSSHGQSLVETALFLPLLLLFLAGFIEVGAYAISYMVMLDASREAARYGANLDPELTSKYPLDMHGEPFPDVREMDTRQLRDVCDDGETLNFYYEVACIAYQNIPSGTLDLNHGDDIVITVVGVKSGEIAYRWPLTPTHANPNDQGYHFRGANDGSVNASCATGNTEHCRSWSLYGVRSSSLVNGSIASRLRTAAPDTGFVIVEIFYAHPHFTGLFTIGDFIPNPILTRPYAIFPVAAAEPKN